MRKLKLRDLIVWANRYKRGLFDSKVQPPYGVLPLSAWMHFKEEAFTSTREEVGGKCQWQLKGRGDIWAGYRRVIPRLLGSRANESQGTEKTLPSEGPVRGSGYQCAVLTESWSWRDRVESGISGLVCHPDVILASSVGGGRSILVAGKKAIFGCPSLKKKGQKWNPCRSNSPSDYTFILPQSTY